MSIFDNSSQVCLVILYNFKRKWRKFGKSKITFLFHRFDSTCHFLIQSIFSFPLNIYHILIILLINLLQNTFSSSRNFLPCLQQFMKIFYQVLKLISFIGGFIFLMLPVVWNKTEIEGSILWEETFVLSVYSKYFFHCKKCLCLPYLLFICNFICVVWHAFILVHVGICPYFWDGCMALYTVDEKPLFNILTLINVIQFESPKLRFLFDSLYCFCEKIEGWTTSFIFCTGLIANLQQDDMNWAHLHWMLVGSISHPAKKLCLFFLVVRWSQTFSTLKCRESCCLRSD